MLKDKKILLGLTGSISAYKAILLLRLLVKDGAEVRVIMTPSAASFVSPLNFSVLSKNKVTVDFTDKDGNWNNHVDLALWADIFVIAPASLNTLSKMANGICDNVLLASYFSSRCPVLIAPAMDVDMFLHPATQRNIKTLQSDACFIVPPAKGELASGLMGEGRLAEPEEILEHIKTHFSETQSLKGIKVLLTAGPTYELIDPVRFIGNFSSGKMGFAIAKELVKRGAQINLVCGPVNLEYTHPSIERFNVISADEMHKKCLELSGDSDLIIMCAAVSDFKVRMQAKEKIKKDASKEMELHLDTNIDILADLGKNKKKNQILIGFALETQNEVENAIKKIKNKNLDFIVLNSLNDEGAGFKTDTNKISIIDNKGEISNFELKSKDLVAIDIAQKIESLIQKKHAS